MYFVYYLTANANDMPKYTVKPRPELYDFI